ncbi:MAG: hypothetical protein OEZ43_20635 [Gammaproteobacteria bacterium]|nr:hypothetical protein [Gammaproteobacteria bacterium]
MRYEDLSPLFRGVEANGAYLINATNPASGAENLIKAIEVLSHNLPIDCAFTEVSGGNGLLVIDERLIAKSRISDRVHTLGKILQRPENASRSITIDNSSAMLLRLPKSTLLREEAGREIEKVHLDYGFLRESDEASAIGHTVMQLQQDDDKSNVPRYLQAGISMPGKDSPVTDKPLVRNKPYEVLVFVGARNSEYLASVEAFPKLQPLDDGRSHQLTVVFWEQNVSEAPQVQHIDLPSVGDSEVCRFSIHTPARIVELHARITLLHKNRVLQTGILIAPVGRKSCEYSFVLDAVPRRVLNGLDERLNFDLAMVVNDIAGLSQVHLSGGSQAAVLKWDHQDIQGLIKIIGASIGQITENPDDFSGLFASGSTKLLRRLAQKGASFRKYLQTVQGFNLSNVSHIQLIIADPTKVLPIEFFYDFPAPEPTAALCVNAARALEFARNDSLDSGRCPGGCPDQPEDQIICPVAFWGIRCIIERRAHRPDEEDINGDARVISEPVLLGDRILNPTVSAVVGATDKANPPSDPDATKKMIERIKAVVGKFREVHNWDEWKGAVADINPSLLTLIVHQEEDDYGTPELDIGQPPNLNSDLIKTAHVPQLTHPVFLLIGCETSLADISYENIAFRFHTEGAVIVVSTIARILGRQAAPLAAEIIEELANLPSSTPFGSVLRNVRCRMLEKGTPMVMALTALGDADWEVVGQSGV